MDDLRDPVPNNLPIPLTSFVGREQEIAEVLRLLTEVRLLTLTGAGGCGKSRLALQVANGEIGRFQHGVWLVELAALADPALVPQAAASALRIDEQTGRTLTDVLADSLRPKSLLLVLDNCEHLLAACASLIDALLRVCPGVRVVATSREALGVPGETIWRVPSLSVPDLTRLPAHDQLMQYEAVRLFVERAASSHRGFRMTEGNGRAVAQVCHRLDGIPLAIELAAARVQALAVEQIAARLDDRFGLLTGGSRTGLPRHRTLQAAMDWSYDFLSERERAVLGRLSVFAGGWTLEAAEAVCAGDGVEPSEVLDALTSLVDKSIVNVETQGGEARYRLLETVRQYARDRLGDSEGAAVVHGQHRDWYLALAERADPGLRGPDQTAWSQRLEAEHDNLRSALEWSMWDEAGAEAGSRLAWALMWFWLMRGHISEGREWLEKMASRAREVSPSVRARVLCGAGALSEKLGEYQRALVHIEDSLALFREQDDRWGAGFALHFLAHVASARADIIRTASLYDESLALFRETGDKWGQALTLDCWGGALIRQGDFERAVPLYDESVALFKELGDKWEIPGPLSGLGMAAAARGDYARATVLLEESLAMVHETMGTGSGATSLLRLGRVVFRQGNLKRAAVLFKESLALRKNRGDKDGIAACLDALAGVAVEGKRLEEAARLFGATEALREAIRTPVPHARRAEYDRYVAAVRTNLTEATLAAAWTEGRTMGLDEAIDYGLTLDPSPPAAKRGGSSAVDRQVALLTSREREVAALIAHGLTNREIAAQLVIVERTAEGHVQSILNKLGFNSRAQIAAWAVGHGLHAVTPG